MHDIRFIDKTFDLSQTHLYHLTIQISLDGIYFTVLDIPKGKYILLQGHHFFLKRPRLLLKHIRDVFESEEVLRSDFKSVEILYSTRKFTLVPQTFYTRNSADKFMWFNNIQERGFALLKNSLPKAECWCIFDIPQNLSDFLAEKFPKIVIRHNLFPLIEGVLKRNRPHSDRSQAHLNFFRENFEMVVINGTKLIYCNMFNFKVDRDILYQVLFAFDQLKLSTEETELFIHGQLPPVSSVYHLFKKYVKSTFFARLDTTYQYSYTFSQLPEHYYSSLLSAYKCE